MRWLICAGVTLVVACNSIVGNDPPKLKTAASVQDAGSVDAAPPGPTCKTDEKVCFGACVPKFSSGFSCASESACDPCPAYDHATPTCNGAVCAAECKKGYDNCETSSPDCETDLASPQTCGGCNVHCTNFCSPDGQGSFKCTDTCEGSLKSCGQKCVDTSSSTTNCGDCGLVCPEPLRSTATCTDGKCGLVCDPGFHRCGDRCVNDANVNACGLNCVDCGSAGQNSTIACNNGQCETTCAKGFMDCDGKKENGCEQDVWNDSNHCGSCVTSCSGGVVTNDYSGGLDPLTIRPIGGACCLQGSCVDCNSF